MPYSIRRYSISYVAEGYKTAAKISNKSDAHAIARSQLQHLPIENAVVIALDASNRCIGFITLHGTAGSCIIEPQQVFAFLLQHGARCFIMAHNHPGGALTASEPDWRITDKLKKVGELLGVDMLDHLIIADDTVISLREQPRWSK